MNPHSLDRSRPPRRKGPSALALAAIALAALPSPGCGTVLFEVPPGRQVRLLEEDEPAAVKVRKRLWYALLGAKPLSDNSTAAIIDEHDLREVRMATEQTVLDNIISSITVLVTISCRTVEVEGNP